MTTPLVKSLIDDQVSNLEQAFRLPRETLVKHLPKPIKGSWLWNLQKNKGNRK